MRITFTYLSIASSFLASPHAAGEAVWATAGWLAENIQRFGSP